MNSDALSGDAPSNGEGVAAAVDYEQRPATNDVFNANSTELPGEPSRPAKQKGKSLEDLMGIARDALDISPRRYPATFFGLPYTWIPPYRRYSEFTMFNLWRLGRMAKFLANITIPSIPRNPPPFGPPLLNNLFWQPTLILQRPDQNGNYTTFPDETWFLINGILTNDSVAQLNAAYVSYLFHRPVTIIQNSTDSFFSDMAQCMIGKEWQRSTEPAIKAFPVIYNALRSSEKRRVVVLAHSQGTIIMANVLRLLYAVAPSAPVLAAEAPFRAEAAESWGTTAWIAPPEFIYPDESPLNLKDFPPLSLDELSKLEVYCFATCANEMKYHPDAGEQPVPWLEHFGNEFDIVARLGMQAPRPKRWDIEIDGPRFVKPGAWGHLLNAHYLFAVADYQKAGFRPGGIHKPDPYEPMDTETQMESDGPRLFRYISGGRGD